MSPEVGDETKPDVDYIELKGIDEVKRIGRRAMSGACVVWCENCKLPFCVDERGIRCRTNKGDCAHFYCQREQCVLPPESDRYLCSLCGSYSCDMHGHVCSHPTCVRSVCQACECLCSVCDEWVCAAHMQWLPVDAAQVCMVCVQKFYPKRMKK